MNKEQIDKFYQNLGNLNLIYWKYQLLTLLINRDDLQELLVTYKTNINNFIFDYDNNKEEFILDNDIYLIKQGEDLLISEFDKYYTASSFNLIYMMNEDEFNDFKLIMDNFLVKYKSLKGIRLNLTTLSYDNISYLLLKLKEIAVSNKLIDTANLINNYIGKESYSISDLMVLYKSINRMMKLVKNKDDYVKGVYNHFVVYYFVVVSEK